MTRVKSVTAMGDGDGDSGQSDVGAAAAVAIAGRRRKQCGGACGMLHTCGTGR